MRVALVFIDGFGLGEADPEINPLAWDGSFSIAGWDNL